MSEHRAQPDTTLVALADLHRRHRVRRALDAAHLELLERIAVEHRLPVAAVAGPLVPAENRNDVEAGE